MEIVLVSRVRLMLENSFANQKIPGIIHEPGTDLYINMFVSLISLDVPCQF